MIEKTKHNIKTAGAWFVAQYINEILEQYDKLDDKIFKEQLITKLYIDGGRDTYYTGTRDRVNAVLSIIRHDEVLQALQYIISSEKIKNEDPETIINANNSLAKILIKKQ